MLRGINFLSEGRDKKSGKKSDQRSEVDFELSRPPDLKVKQDKQKDKKKDKKKVKKEKKVESKLEKTQDKFKPDKYKDRKNKRVSWWHKVFGKNKKQMDIKQVEQHTKDEAQLKIGDGGPSSLTVAMGEDKKPEKNFLKDEYQHKGFTSKRESIQHKTKAKADMLTLSQVLSQGGGDKDRSEDFDINLIPAEKKGLKTGQRIMLVLLITIIMAGLEYLTYALLKQANNKHLGEISMLNGQLISANKAIDDMDEGADRALTWYVKMAAAEELLGQHEWWSKFFTALETNTHINTYYKSLNITQGGKVVLSGVAKDYKSLAQAILGFEGADYFMQEYKVSGIAAEEIESVGENQEPIEGVGFLLSFTVNPDYLLFEGIK